MNESRTFPIIQNLPDYCFEPFDNSKEIKKNLNSRYSYFKQNYYTVGDGGQFIQNWKTLPKEEKSIEVRFKKEHLNFSWKKYQNLCIHDVYNTYNYIADKFKKGCFLQFNQNELCTFLPFSKQDYRNEWRKSITFDDKFPNIYELMKYTHTLDAHFPYDENRIHKDMEVWYGNNGLVRFEYPMVENDTGYNMLKDMFVSLSKEREIPDVDFFLNKRDFPILSKHGYEAYEVFFGEKTPLVSHVYDKYVPILSMNSSDEFADIAIPTWDDWCRVAYQTEKKLFSKDFLTCPSEKEFDSIRWEEKKPTLIFRGTSTGRGTRIDNNIRLFYASMSTKEMKDENGNLLMDCGITKWNLRPRKASFHEPLTTIFLDELNIPLKSFMSPLEQAHYKYILHLPGHTCAYRLSLEMYFGSVIFIYPCKQKLWFFDWLKPWEHYIPLSEEFSEEDVLKKLKWCRENDEKAQQIAINARKFASKYLGRQGILDYLQSIFCSIANKSTNYKYLVNSLHHVQLGKMCNSLNESMGHLEKDFMTEIVENALDGVCESKTIMNLSYQDFFWTELFHYLSKNGKIHQFIESHSLSIDFFKGKKNNFKLFQWNKSSFVQKEVLPNWKDDAIHQYFVGKNYINSIAKKIPNFIKTYYSYTNREQDTKNLIVEYRKGKTLDIMIQNNEINFSDLLKLWINVCLALEYAQQSCGFIHMDLYPWNIVVEDVKMKFSQSFLYKDEKIKTIMEMDFIPVLIDYGNSHVSDKGFHYYTTTPFYLNRFHDVICMIISSLDLYLKNNKLQNYEIRTLLQIMSFFSNSSMYHKSFSNLSDIRWFLKKHKKFSVMLSFEKKGFENISPLDFVFFLIDKKIINHDYIQIFSHVESEKKKIYFQYHHSPEIYTMKQYTKCIQACIGDKNIPQQDIYIWTRRCWLNFYHYMKEYKIKTAPQEIATFSFLQNFKKFVQALENQYFKKLWTNYLFKDITENSFFYTDEDFQLTLEQITKEQKYLFPQLPLLKTHNCLSCFHKKQRLCYKNEFFENTDTLYMLQDYNNEPIDLYSRYIQNGKEMYQLTC